MDTPSRPSRYPVTAETLDSHVEIDHPFRIHPDGTLSDAPEVRLTPEYLDDALETPRDSRWALVSSGYTGQHGARHQPVMHDSESIGGRLAQDLLDRPGVYVVLPAQWTVTEDECTEEHPGDEHLTMEGWVIARLEEGT